MQNDQPLETIGTLDNFFTQYKAAHACQFACQIIKTRWFSCDGTAGGGHINGNVVEIPKRTSGVELHADAEVFNCFGNFMVRLFYSGSNIEQLKNVENTLNQLIQDERVCIVQSEAYSFIDGVITLYNPKIKAFQDHFPSLFSTVER